MHRSEKHRMTEASGQRGEKLKKNQKEGSAKSSAIIQGGHPLTLLLLLHSLNPPSPLPLSCSSWSGPVGEGKGFLRSELSLSPWLHHLQSMPLRAGRNAAHTRGVRMCTLAHGATCRLVIGWWRDAEDRGGGALLSFFS